MNVRSQRQKYENEEAGETIQCDLWTICLIGNRDTSTFLGRTPEVRMLEGMLVASG